MYVLFRNDHIIIFNKLARVYFMLGISKSGSTMLHTKARSLTS